MSFDRTADQRTRLRLAGAPNTIRLPLAQPTHHDAFFM
jgi:hypothetical protein